MSWTEHDNIRRAGELYRDIQAQRAKLRNYQDALNFVRVRQSEAPHTIEPVAKRLWEMASYMRGDMNPDWNER